MTHSFTMTDAVESGGGGFWQIDIQCADGDFTAAEVYGDDLAQVTRRATAMLSGLQTAVSTSTCGTQRSEVSPNPHKAERRIALEELLTAYDVMRQAWAFRQASALHADDGAYRWACEKFDNAMDRTDKARALLTTKTGE